MCASYLSRLSRPGNSRVNWKAIDALGSRVCTRACSSWQTVQIPCRRACDVKTRQEPDARVHSNVTVGGKILCIGERDGAGSAGNVVDAPTEGFPAGAAGKEEGAVVASRVGRDVQPEKWVRGGAVVREVEGLEDLQRE